MLDVDEEEEEEEGLPTVVPEIVVEDADEECICNNVEEKQV